MYELDKSAPAINASARGRRVPVTYRSAGVVLAVCEAITIIATSVAVGVAYHLATAGVTGNLNEYVSIGLLVAALYSAALNAQELYEPAQIFNDRASGSKLFALWAATFALIAVLAFTFKAGDQFSRGAALGYFFFGAFTTLTCRKVYTRWIHNLIAIGALTGPRVALLTDGGALPWSLLEDLRRHGFLVKRTFTVDDANYDKAAERLVAYVRGRHIDEVLLAVSCSQRKEIARILERMRVLPMPVHLLADDKLKPLLECRPEHIGSSIALELRRAPLDLFEQALKRCLDITLAGTALLISAPAMLVIGALIRYETPGPVFFRQTRIGFNGRSFSIYKFRSMTALDNGPVIRQAVVNDPRVTRLGKWLRRTSMDELPQLLNVIGGEMSLIGPRPHARAHDTEFDTVVADYALRHHVKPGITGWAQVNGCRGETPDEESIRRRVEHDLWYIDNWSLLLEFRILSRTARAIARGAF